jgi:hypothetical protein
LLLTGKILLVEPEDALRRSLESRLEEAGHDVAAVQDDAAAVRLIHEGLDPDVVLAPLEGPDAPGRLRDLVPRAAHLRIDPDLMLTEEFPADGVGEPMRCNADPDEVLRRVEEALLALGPSTVPDGRRDEGRGCLDLARRLASSLPKVASIEDRVDLVTEAFDFFYGVRGTLVVYRDRSAEGWIEASRGLDAPLAARISEEISLRSSLRGLRPFLIRLEVDGGFHEVACVAVGLGARETDLAIALRGAPADPGLREGLMNLVGSAMRAAATRDELERSRGVTEGQSESLKSLLETVDRLTRFDRRGPLADRILTTLRREIGWTKTALFLPRTGGDGLLDLQASYGFAPHLLDRIGLSLDHGLGRGCLDAKGVVVLDRLDPEGLGSRELRLLTGAGLRWGAALRADDHRLGMLIFGGRRDDERRDPPELEPRERRALDVVLSSAHIALRNLLRLEDLQDLSLVGLQGLVAAAELRFPEDRGHAERVARGALALGRACGLSDGEMRNLVFCALVHDVGKTGVDPPAAGSGDPVERRHPVLGSRILSRAKAHPSLLHGVEQHHERYDGCGFPFGLKGEDIHLFGRIIAIVDSFDRLTHDSIAPVSQEEALRRLERGAGLLHDPGLVALFAEEVGRAPGSEVDAPNDTWLTTVFG